MLKLTSVKSQQLDKLSILVKISGILEPERLIELLIQWVEE